MQKTESESERQVFRSQAERMAVRLGLCFERMDVWLAAVITGALLAVAYLGLTAG